jgi:hypothetical protein
VPDDTDPDGTGSISDMAFANFLVSISVYPARIERERHGPAPFDERPGSPRDLADREAHEYLVRDFYAHRHARRARIIREQVEWVDIFRDRRRRYPRESYSKSLAWAEAESKRRNRRPSA